MAELRLSSERIPAERKKLRLWALIGVSVATVGPTMAMSGNTQGIVGSVGKGLPVVFIFGLIGVALIALAFVVLTRYTNHAGSAYGIVGKIIGPRAGFFSGFAMAGAYITLAICTCSIFAASTNSFLSQLQGTDNPHQLPWIVPVLAVVAGSALLAGRDIRFIATVLMWFQAIGVVAMIVLAVTIFAKGGAPSTGFDFTVFTFDAVTPSAALAGVVIAFLSWAGFEACVALGEEGDNPRRNIPVALVATVALLGLLYLTVVFAQVIGFGTDAEGLAALGASGNTLGELSRTYLGTLFSLVIVFTAAMSAFAANLACASAAGRLLFAFSRDGFGPKVLSRADSAGGPRNAVMAVIAICLVVNTVSWATKWPNMGTGNPAIDSYFFFATVGSVALIVCYLMVELAAIRLVVSRLRSRTSGPASGLVFCVALLTAGAIVIVVVLWQNMKSQPEILGSPAYLAIAWCAVGLAISMGAVKLSRRIGQTMTAER
ncbi:APC family permease [Nocardia sp. KC 131]|uniref:APC family permease n=1 Tax=Nocardia arseniciresistens TaxID=3392119 RepID=UPI00398EE28A